MSYYISGRNGFVGSHPLSPCKLHVFSIFRLLYAFRGPLQPHAIKSYPSSQFPTFITPKLLNSPPLCLSASPAFSLYHTAPLYTSLIPSHGPSPPLSPSHLYPSITNLSSASSTHSQTLFFPIFAWYPLALLSSHPIPPFTHTNHPLLYPCLLALFHPSLLFPRVLFALYTHHGFWRVCCPSLLEQFSN